MGPGIGTTPGANDGGVTLEGIGTMSTPTEATIDSYRQAVIAGLQRRVGMTDTYTLAALLEAHEYFTSIAATTRLDQAQARELVTMSATWRNMCLELNASISNAIFSLGFMDDSIDPLLLIDDTASSLGITVNMSPAASSRFWFLLRQASHALSPQTLDAAPGDAH